jgi:signal transduction histidine kinase
VRSRTAEPVAASPHGVRRGSLRAELLFNLAFVAAAALLLALAVTGVLGLRTPGGRAALLGLVVLVAFDLLVFVALGRYLIGRLVGQPLAEITHTAEAIADGDYERRVALGATREVAALAGAFNRLTDQLLSNQGLLAENVRSLDETNQRLVTAQRELVQAEKLASIGRLSAGIAHEIGNPLGALLGYASVLRRRGGDAELIDGVEREARRIDRIVRGLLDYARPGAGMREEREPLDVNRTIESVVELLHAQGRLQSVEVRLALEPGLPAVYGVAYQLEQLFVNLIVNADAAMAGSGALRIDTAAEPYRIDRPLPRRRADDPPGIDYSHLRRMERGQGGAERLREDETVVRITVEDSGPGIAPELLDVIFDPFVTSRAPGEGTGLGLAIVASTVAELGGRIDATNAPGGGACFTLLLPTTTTT